MSVRSCSTGGLPLSAVALVAVMLMACGDAGKRPLGGDCGQSAECASGLCLDGSCVDPLGDQDGDGLNNGLESALGSNSNDPDSDRDGVSDPDELGNDLGLVDTDGDGKPDIIESATADVDGDCITDQFDANDGVTDSDPSPMLSQVCSRDGICGEQPGQLRVSCASGSAACVYDQVVGYANPEIACDGRDENCDGSVDEPFDGCDVAVRSWIAPATSGVTTESNRHRALLGYGPPINGTTQSTRHKVVLGRLNDAGGPQ